jgi:outer membrane receptor for ferrienterochelin and colicins
MRGAFGIRWSFVFFLTCNILVLANLAWSQNSGGVSGRVLDPQGLPVESVQVTLRNTLTGEARQQATSASGLYTFNNVQPGSFVLSAVKEGFTGPIVRVEIHSNPPSVNQDIRLRVAAVREDVTVVSGSRLVELEQSSPVPVDVVTAHDIVTTGKETVGSVLSEVPGVVTRDYSTFKQGLADQQVQGIDSRQVLILRDGLPIGGARGINSGVVDLNEQSIGSLEQIEVVKGAASALYGSDAIGGVINLITRQPNVPFTSSLSISGGSLGTFDARGSIGGKVGKLWLLLDLERHQGDSYRLIAEDPTTTGPDYGRNLGSLQAHYDFSEKAKIGFSATGYHDHNSSDSFTETGLVFGAGNDSEKSFAATGDFKLTSSTGLRLRGYIDNYDENSLLKSVPVVSTDVGDFSNLAERYHRADATLTQAIGTHQFLQGGYEWAEDLYRGVNRVVGDNVGQQIATNDVWAEDRIQLLPRLLLTAGVRYQHHSNYGNHTVPKIGANFRVTDHLSLRASYGEGFRAPDLGQLYYRFANPASFYQVIGNPNLQPETSRSTNVGFSYSQSRWRAGVNLYRNNVKHLIDYVYAGFPISQDDLDAILQQYGIPADFDPLLGRATYVYLNLNRIYTQGAEINGEIAIARNLKFAGAYTYLDAYDQVNQAQLPNRHRHQGFIKAEYDNPRHGFSANIRGSLFSSWFLDEDSHQKDDAYGIWSIYGSKSVSHGVSFYTAIENVFNSTDPLLRSAEPTYYRADPGRLYRVGMRFNFPARND